MEATGNNKRGRNDSDESPEAKRLHVDLLLDILDDIDSGDRDPAAQDLATVMKIFEEEITSPPSQLPPAPAELSAPDSDEPRQPDLGYLLEASDDELGLPPTIPCWSDDGRDADAAAGEAEDVGFGQIWGFEDEIRNCYDGFDFGFRPEEREEESLFFEGGLFDNYSDVASGPSDFSWRPESLPAV